MPENISGKKTGEKRAMDVYLASPRGFCAGVERAIETVKDCLHQYGSPVFVLHEIVHNKRVIEELRERGAIFVESLEEIPKGGICIFSAHGVSRRTEQRAAALGLHTVDATCPLVTSVHRMVEKLHGDGGEVIIIGHHNHPEVEGSAGRVTNRVHIVADVAEAESLEVANPENLGYVTQTTLSKNDLDPIVSVLEKRYPKIHGPRSNICFATQNRQDAVRKLAELCEVVLVVGSKNSSNSNRLREVAVRCGAKAYLIDDCRDIQDDWLDGTESVGITAGASAPEALVTGVVRYLENRYRVHLREMDGIKESVHFRSALLE